MNLVTGGAGYIGSHFIKRYLETHPGEELLVIDDLSQGHAQALRFSDRIRVVQQDMGSVDAMTAVFRQFQVDTVIHFAASCYVGESQQDPVKYFQNNGVNTLNLLRAMQVSGVRQMVFSSSCATYGNPAYSPIDEAHPQRPINVYGTTKLMIEQALQAYSQSQGWSVAILRYFNAAGADESALIGEHHDPETHLIPLVLQTALGRHEAVSIFGEDYETRDGTCVRDYVHVNDLAQAHIQAMGYLREHPGCCEAFNLGTSKGASVLEVVEMCRQVTGRDIPVRMHARRPGDPPRLVANADKARQQLNWQPGYDLKRMVETAWAWEQGPRFADEALSAVPASDSLSTSP